MGKEKILFPDHLVLTNLHGLGDFSVKAALVQKKTMIIFVNRPFATNDHMVQNPGCHTGGQAHYYSRTGTLKQRQVKLDWLWSLCFNVPVRK